MNLIGRKIFYLTLNGQVVLDTGEMMGSVRKLEIDECFQVYEILKQYSREEIEMLELEYGQYAQDFAECNGYMVNVGTGLLEFSYPEPNSGTPQEPVYRKPLTEQVLSLQDELAQTNALLLEFMESMMA